MKLFNLRTIAWHLVCISALLCSAPLAFTSCENEHPELNVTLTSDYSTIINAIKNVNSTLSDKLALIEEAIKNGTVASGEANDLIKKALETMNGTLEDKLAAIEEAIKSQTTSLESKLGLIETALKTGFTDQKTALGEIKTALESIKGSVDGLDSAIDGVVTAIDKVTTAVDGTNTALTGAIAKALDDIFKAIDGLTDYSAILEAIKEAIENIEISGDGDDTEPEAPGINGHTYVEMGDGLKWATMNIGATKPEEYGDYFAWGETATKESYAWTNYIFAKDPSDYSSGVKKYSEEDSYKTLFPEDDAATSLWKDPWRMPTEGEWAALRDEKLYTWKWETNYNGSGKNGMLVTRKEGTGPCAGNSIFLPAAGRRYESQWLYEGSQGFYWSSSLDTALFAMGVDVLDSGSRWLTADRYAGLNVRPVSD